MRVLFVCTGNTCRSPMAEALLNREIQTEHKDGWMALSAGLMPGVGAPAAEQAQTVMQQRGVNLQDHRARRLAEAYVQAADLVVVMTGAMKDMVRKMYPEEEDKVLTLSEWAGETGDISDPFGGTLAEYKFCASEIERKILQALKHMEK